MRSSWLVVYALLGPSQLWGQAPPSAELWRLSAASLALPPSLEWGPAGIFWNPASVDLSRRLVGAIELTQTPDIVGVAGFVAGVHYRLRPALAAMVLVGRADIDDIVRTTTSARSDLGTIPIYEQLAGAGAVVAVGAAQAGVLVRGHDARFDAERESGITIDGGFRIAMGDGLTLGGATHFFPLDFTTRDMTEYFLGADYRIGTRRMLGGEARFHVRYGATHRANPGTDHALGVGMWLDDQLSADVALVREQGYVESELRPVLGLSLRVARYVIRVGRASGVNGVGATYRIGLESGILP